MANDVQEWEDEAIIYGGQMGGEYLESIRITDLAELSPAQWHTFITIITTNYHAKHSELQPCPF